MRHIAQRSDIKDLILDAVDALLAKYGYKKMTIDDVARQVGIGKGTIYIHFPGKEELILSHIDRIAERVVARLREIAAQSAPYDRRLRDMIAARVLIRFDSVARYSQSLSDLLSSVRAALLVRREAYFKIEAGIFAVVLREGAKRGYLDCPDPEGVARVLIQSTNSLLPFSLSARELGHRDEIVNTIDSIASLLVKGLAAHPKRPIQKS